MSGRDSDPPVRQGPFQRNAKLEELLALLENPLGAGESLLLAELGAERRPIVLIVACARSGSTLLLQFLAGSGAFAYPSNFLSRFYAAPILGSLIQKMLFDPAYQFRRELACQDGWGEPYRSELGKTEGALSPNEFLYFWRRWVEEIDGRPPTLEDTGGIDFGEIRRELQGVAASFERPFVLKAHILNWMLPVVAEQLRDAYLVFLRRDPLFTAQSLLEARMRFFGSAEEWYSFKPPEFERLRQLSPEGQVASQVLCTERAIETGIRDVERARVIELSYEELTLDPASAWRKLADKLASHPGCPDLGECPRQEGFRSANVRRLPPASLEAIEAALAEFER